MARRNLDRYYTSEAAIVALLEAYPDLIRGDRLGDPSAGDGRMARMLLHASRFGAAYLNDIDPSTLAATHLDLVDAIRQTQVDWWVSNMPFFAMGDGAKACLESGATGIALLGRCTFLEPCGPSHACRRKRPVIPCSPDRCLRNGRRWITETPPTRILSIPRISFTGDGQSDSAPAWWFVWLRGADGAWQRGTIEVMERPTGQLSLGVDGV